MRFPFFKNEKAETKPTVRAPIQVRRSSLADTQPLQRLPGNLASDTQPVTPPSSAALSSGPCISLGLASIVQQLPQQLFTDAGRAQLDSIKLSMPVGLVLSQLSTGKVSLKLEDLVVLLPAHVLRSPLPPVSDQQCVVLPLHEVIAAIPPDLLHVEHDSEISADDPELAKLPNLIDDAMLNAASIAASTATPTEAVQPEKEQSRATSTLVVPPRPKTTDAPEYVMVSLRALVAVMPDAVFCCPRTQLATKVNLDTPVLLPTDPIIPQLRSAAVKLPLSIIIAMVPHQVLANPMPALDGQMVPIPLVEIIPQLPKTVFTDYLREPSQENEVTTDEIPDPFHEKSATAAAPAAESVTTQPFESELGIEEAALDDSFSIFSERTPAPPAEPVTPAVVEASVETPVPEPEVQPQITEPVIEPVAERPSSIEPIVEPVAEPVVESVEETIAEQITAAPIAASDTEPVTDLVEETIAEQIASEPMTEPIVEPVAESVEELIAEQITTSEPVSEPEPLVEPVAEVVPAAEPGPEPVLAAMPEVEQPVVTPEPEVLEPVASVPRPVVESVSSQEPVTEATAVDEKKLLVDLNRCSVEDLVTIPGVGRALAQRIVDFRNSRGQFHSVDELRQVPGIGRKTYRALAGIQPRALNRLLGAPHDGELTLQEIVRLTGKLPGIDGCMLATSDGLFLTGELPPHLDQSTISVFAPQLFRKVGRYARELKVGSIRRFTIFTDTQPISIFRAGDVYLIVIHDAFRFSKALLRRCERISQEIGRLSSQRVTV